MEKIYLSNITDKMVIDDLVKFIKVSGVDLEDIAISNEKNWIEVEKENDSIYNLCIQSGSLWFDIRIHYGESKAELEALAVRMVNTIDKNYENWFGVRLIDGDTLEYTTTVECVDKKISPIKGMNGYHKEKIGKLQTSSVIDKIIDRIKPMVTAYKNATYIESSLARVCGITLKDDSTTYYNNNTKNNIKMVVGESDSCSFQLKYNSSDNGNGLRDLVISIERKLPDETKVSFDIRGDMGNRLYLSARKMTGYSIVNDFRGYFYDAEEREKAMEKTNEVLINDSILYATELEATTWEELLDTIDDIVDKPLEVYDNCVPVDDEIGVPKMILPITGIKK